jgi:hypothetical protein
LFWEDGPTIEDIRFDDDYKSRWPTPADQITRLLITPEHSERDQLLERVGKLRAMAAGCRRVVEEYEVVRRERGFADSVKGTEHYNRMWQETNTVLTSLSSTMWDQVAGAAVPAALSAAAALGVFFFPSQSLFPEALAAVGGYFVGKGIEVLGLFGQGPLNRLARRPGMFLAHMVDHDGKGLIVPPASLMDVWGLDTREATRASRHLQSFSETVARLNRTPT